MHDEIIRFSISGEIDDSNLVENKEKLVWFLENQMRDSGCLPSIDLEPHFTLDYKPERETYDFSLTVYGVFVGKEKACEGSGVTAGKMIPKHSQKAKSRES